jgi:PLP dependent protein
MTIPPFFENPDQSRPFFAQLRELRDRIESAHPGSLGRKHLSMGMSHDFRVAIEEGATIVRIGTAIFGNREPAKTPIAQVG